MTREYKKIVAVTGGAGFIGSNFILYMAPKYSDYLFVNIDNLTYAANLENLLSIEEAPNYIFRKLSITDYDSMAACFEDFKFDIVVNFAAETHVDRSIYGPAKFVSTNILGTFNILELIRKHKESGREIRYCHISTDEVYGSLDNDKDLFSEESPYQPNSPYSATKAGSDHLVRAYVKTYGLDAMVTHSCNNYGPRQFPEKLIPLAVNNILTRKKIPVYGKGDNIRDWLYVEDNCRAIDLIIHQGKSGETYLISAQNELKNIDLVKKICEIVDNTLGISGSERLITYVEDRPGHDYRYGLDAKKIQNHLGWKPQYEFERALELTIRWYLDNQDWLNNCTSGKYRDYYDMVYKVKRSGNDK